MDYIILCLGKYDRLQSEFELKKRLESVLIDEAEYRFLKHFAETLTALEKRLHDSVKKNDMTTHYLHEFEGAAIVPRWISAMDSNPPIVVKDRDEISGKNLKIFVKRNKKRFLVGYHLKGHFLFLPPAAVTV